MSTSSETLGTSVAAARVRWSPSVLARSWVAPVLLAFVLSRIATTCAFAVVAATAHADSSIGSSATLLTALNAWDGQWYARIAIEGYPITLPIVDGEVQTNAWAFLPAYPFLVKVLALGSPAAWPLIAPLVSTAFGLASALSLHRLVAFRAGPRAAIAAVLLYLFGPTSFILQTAYAESMALFLMFTALALIDRQRYLPAIPVVLLLAFTRPGAQAVALALGITLVPRLLAWTHDRSLRGARDLAPALVLLIVALAAGFAWPVIAGVATGSRDAYLETELAWRTSFTGSADLTLFTQWWFAARFWFGRVGQIVLVVGVLGFAAVLASRAARRLGSTIIAWSASWTLYLLAVFFPQSSTLRLLMPLAPLGGVAGRLPRWLLVVALAACAALQFLMIHHAYGAVASYDSAP